MTLIPGPNNQLITQSLSPTYPYISNANVMQYVPADTGSWDSPPPTTIQEALDRLAAASPGA